MAMAGEETGRGAQARPTGVGRFQTAIRIRDTELIADEPAEVGGGGTGPTPYELLSSALAACTAMTMRLYAERKGWALPPFVVEVAHSLAPPAGDGPPRDRFDRQILFEGPIEETQRVRLLEIADKCPVHRTLARGADVRTGVGPSSEPLATEPPEAHEQQMEQTCAG